MPLLKECYSPELSDNKLKNKMQSAAQNYFVIGEKNANSETFLMYKYGLKVDSVTVSVISKEVNQ